MSRRAVPVPELFEAAVAGDRAALARLLSLVERGGDDGSMASTATSSPSERRWPMVADVSVLLPAPGAPVSPTV